MNDRSATVERRRVGLRRQRGPRELGVLYVCLFVIMAGYGSTLVVLPDHIQLIDALAEASPDVVALHVGLLTGVYALAQLIAGPVAGRLADRVGYRAALLGGLTVLAATQAAFAFVTSLPVMYLLRVFGGVAAACAMVAATACVTARTSNADRLRGMAWFGTSVSLGIVAGPAIAGLLSRPMIDTGVGPFHIDSYSIPFFASAALTLTGVAFARNRLSSGAPMSPATTAAATQPRTIGWPLLWPLLGLVTAAQYALASFEGTFVLYSRNRLALSTSQTTAAFIVCGAVMAGLQVPVSGVAAKVASPLTQIAVGFAVIGIGISLLLTRASRDEEEPSQRIGRCSRGRSRLGGNRSARRTGAALGH